MTLEVGMRFGRLTVVADRGANVVLCSCECGQTAVATRANLRAARHSSCGCLRREQHQARCAEQRNQRPARFWARVNQRNDDDCWPWIGPLDEKGYGRTSDGTRSRKAHDVAYELAIGAIPDGMEPDHTCHDASVCHSGDACPHRACCNPRHLKLVTHRENCQRAAYALACCVAGHLLPEPDVRGRRVCRACANERNRRYKRKIASLRPVKQRPALEHGTRSKYVHDRCRCEACRTAERFYRRERKGTKAA